MDNNEREQEYIFFGYMSSVEYLWFSSSLHIYIFFVIYYIYKKNKLKSMSIQKKRKKNHNSSETKLLLLSVCKISWGSRVWKWTAPY